jgi:hypothetical protein
MLILVLFPVTLPYPLIAKFFKTLTDSSIIRMAFSLDGVNEWHEQQESTVHCAHARWLMEYDNGYVVELDGVLQATCRTVPMEPYNPTSASTDENGAPTTGDGQHQSTTRAGSSNPQSSSPHVNSSPASNPANPANATNSTNANPNPNPGSNTASPRAKSALPYTVKIESFSFDSRGLRKWIDAERIQSSVKSEHGGPKYGTSTMSGMGGTGMYDLPQEPQISHGMPNQTIRMLELSETDHVLEPLMDFMVVSNFPGGPMRE